MNKTVKSNDSSNSELSEVEKLRQELEALKSLLTSQVTAPKELPEERVHAEEIIQVMSLCPYPLNLTTQQGGKGKNRKFDKFGQVKGIMYSDLVDILEVNRRFSEQGYFRILDKRVIKKHGLDEAYATLLTKEMLEQIFDCGNSAIELYKSANEQQREFANQVIIRKLRNGEALDLNIVAAISAIAKVDLAQKAEESKALMEMENK